MKKFDLFKIMGIAFAITILLSWIIPAGSYQSGTFTSLESTFPMGLYDIVRTPAITFASFAYYGLVFLAIGGFYGVLNKIGVFSKVVESVSNSWKGNSKKFLLISTGMFALLSSIVGLQYVLFILVPLFAAIVLALGYNKLTAFASTVGAMLVGSIGSILGNEFYWQYYAGYYGKEISSLFLVKAILFVIVTVLYMLILNKKLNTKTVKLECSKCGATIKKNEKFCSKCGTKVTAKAKEEKEEEKIVVPMVDKKTTKKGTVPFTVVLVAVVVLLILGMYGWNYAFKFTWFTELHDSIMALSIGEYPIVSNILGTVSAIGSWGNYDIIVILVFASLLLGWIYSVKFNDILDGFKNGMKSTALTALYAVLASTVFYAVYLTISTHYGSFVDTIINKILGMSDGFNSFTSLLSSIVMGLFYNDFSILTRFSFFSVFTNYDAAALNNTAFITEAVSGLINVIAPTSIFLLAGLKYLEVPYKDWVKYIWKFVLIVLAIIVAIALIITLV